MYLEHKGDWTIGTLFLSRFRRFEFLFQNPLLGLFPLFYRGVRSVPVNRINHKVAEEKLPGDFSHCHSLLIAHCTACQEILEPVVCVVLGVHVPAQELIVFRVRDIHEHYLLNFEGLQSL